MNRSYNKIRHIQESNQRLERRLLNEQLTGDTTTPTTTPTVNLPTCSSKMVNDGRPGSSSEMTGSYTKITFNGTISPESQGYTVHTANGPFCFVPTGNKNYNKPPSPPVPLVTRPQPGPGPLVTRPQPKPSPLD